MLETQDSDILLNESCLQCPMQLLHASRLFTYHTQCSSVVWDVVFSCSLVEIDLSFAFHQSLTLIVLPLMLATTSNKQQGLLSPHLSPHNNSMGLVDCSPLLPRRRHLLRRTPKQYHSRHDVFLLRIGLAQSVMPVEKVPHPSSIVAIHQRGYLHDLHSLSALLLHGAWGYGDSA